MYPAGYFGNYFSKVSSLVFRVLLLPLSLVEVYVSSPHREIDDQELKEKFKVICEYLKRKIICGCA
jgi:hypothetical protein